ncbi:MAG: hypothetical protein WCD70_00795 [Alphaproteobacteria bacterium]
MNLDLTICRADEVVGLVNSRALSGLPYDAVISLEHPGAERLTAEEGRAPRLADEIGTFWQDRQLILTCWDVEHTRFGAPTPTPDIVTDAVAFADKWTPADRPLRLLVHCRSGRARSTAVGLGLLLHKNNLTTEQSIAELVKIRDIAAPNIVIVRHIDDFLKYGGTLTAAVEADTGMTKRREESERKRKNQVESGKFRLPNP